MRSTIPADTTPEAARVHRDAMARLGLAGRAKLTFDLSDNLRDILEAGVRHRHREYDENEVRLATIRLLLGNDLFRRVHPGVEVEP